MKQQWPIFIVLCREEYSKISAELIHKGAHEYGTGIYSEEKHSYKNVCNPLTVWLVCKELPIEQILVSIDLLPQVLPLSFSADLRQNPILLQNSQYCFGIMVDSLAFEPQVHSMIAICLVTSVLMCLHPLG